MSESPLILRIARVRDQARLTRSFDLAPADDGRHVEFVPGQVAILGVRGEEPAYFAFASAPDDAEMEVLVKQRIGASRILYDLHEGDEIRLLGLPERGVDVGHHTNRHLVLVAMGTGVARLRSVLRRVLNHRESNAKHLVVY
jgi:ferredoxin-NADP reductase